MATMATLVLTTMPIHYDYTSGLEYIVRSTVPNLAFPRPPLQLLSLTVCAVSVMSCGGRPSDEATSDLQPFAVQLASIHLNCLNNRGGWKLVISRTHTVANTVESLLIRTPLGH